MDDDILRRNLDARDAIEQALRDCHMAHGWLIDLHRVAASLRIEAKVAGNRVAMRDAREMVKATRSAYNIYHGMRLAELRVGL